jgi:type IV pilus assembly protein PilA
MKDYLKLRKEELKKRGAKGFTLMEMLIVVAIIAVLIAIAIPIFTSQLEHHVTVLDPSVVVGPGELGVAV